jgi:3-hydroxyisobutyrate dehydrogenase
MNDALELIRWSNLESIHEQIWAALVRGAADRKDEFHTPVVATVRSSSDDTGKGTGIVTSPEMRVVVLRKAIPESREVWFHTDTRTEKMNDLRANPRCSLLFYHPRKQFQIRVAAIATLHTDDAVADVQWERTALASRRCYCGEETPGAASAEMSSGLPPFLRTRQPSVEESMAGRVNFGVVRCVVQRIEWLLLHHEGHRRAEFSYTISDDKNSEINKISSDNTQMTMHSTWLVP